MPSTDKKSVRSCYLFEIKYHIWGQVAKVPKLFFYQLNLVIKRAEMKNILRQQILSQYNEPNKKLERCKDDTSLA